MADASLGGNAPKLDMKSCQIAGGGRFLVYRDRGPKFPNSIQLVAFRVQAPRLIPMRVLGGEWRY